MSPQVGPLRFVDGLSALYHNLQCAVSPFSLSDLDQINELETEREADAKEEERVAAATKRADSE